MMTHVGKVRVRLGYDWRYGGARATSISRDKGT